MRITYCISTHTLTWSVTFLAKRHINHANISTHTLTWSVTINSLFRSIFTANFNSHAHVERDNQKTKPFTGHKYFNSHAHVERDMTITDFIKLLQISTHTLTWSVTSHANKRFYGYVISTHTLTWSVTVQARKRSWSRGFQLTRSRGA